MLVHGALNPRGLIMLIKGLERFLLTNVAGVRIPYTYLRESHKAYEARETSYREALRENFIKLTKLAKYF